VRTLENDFEDLKELSSKNWNFKPRLER